MSKTVASVVRHKNGKKSEYRWMGRRPEKCELCSKNLRYVFFDANIGLQSVGFHGPWALVCAGCFQERGCRLGVGFGQAYDLRTLAKLSDDDGYDAAKRLTQ